MLTRFREYDVAVSGDIESMFHCFYVNIEDRDYLRFFWWKDNDPKKQIVEYRMRVHLFGNTSSPGVATYCLHYAADESRDPVVIDFIKNHFYVDDGLASFPTTCEAIDALQRTRAALFRFNIRLHKLVSNDATVLNAFEKSETAEKPELETNEDFCERILGVSWKVEDDCFHVKHTNSRDPSTKRQLLSVINSVYDPLGMVSPVLLKGRQILRKATSQQYLKKIGLPSSSAKWDDELPTEVAAELKKWTKELPAVETLSIPRVTIGTKCQKFDLHIFSDASDIAIGNVLYIAAHNGERATVTFVQGESRLHPLHANTILRLELCAAVAAVGKYVKFKDESTRNPTNTILYADSKIVLGYINNNHRAFTKYVTRRIEYILSHTTSSQWRYVNTKDNPADIATRGLSPTQLKDSIWFTGPKFLVDGEDQEASPEELTEQLPEEKLEKSVLATQHRIHSTFRDKISRFSTWERATCAISALKERARKQKGEYNYCKRDLWESAQCQIVKWFQSEALNKSSNLEKLSPFQDGNGVLRIGGRLTKLDLAENQRHPIIIPKQSHLSCLIIDYAHRQIHHQGRLITLSNVIDMRYHIIGVRKQLRSYLSKCVTCRKQRLESKHPKMADLPSERVNPSPPFTQRWSGHLWTMDSFRTTNTRR